jgi:hypothetical protein
MSERQFPILNSDRTPDLPRSVPWSFVAPHERQAVRNHGQTLERLAQRQGLCWVELWHVINGKDWDYSRKYDNRWAAEQILAAISSGIRNPD